MSRTHRSQQRRKDVAATPPRAGSVVQPVSQVDDAPQRGERGTSRNGVRIGRTRVGKGVFARRRYPPATVVGEILGDVIAAEHYGSDYCMEIGGGRVLEPHAPFRYVNHSCEPNCEFDWFDLILPGANASQRHVFLITLREIKPGDELTIAYNWSAANAIVCRCGEPTCRGWIVDPQQLDDVTTRHGAVAPDA